ncbi:MAG: TolC family protein [bacterium]|nr:TolC family protein [bacterium]
MPSRSSSLFVLAACMVAFTVAAESPVVRIGVIVDGPSTRDESILELVRQEVTNLLANDYDVRFPEALSVQGDWTAESVRAGLDTLLNKSNADVVLTMGVLSSIAVSRAPALPKPVIAPFVPAPSLAGLPNLRGASGVHNLCYFSVPDAVLRDLAAFQQLVPFTRLAILGNGVFLDALPELHEGVRAMGETLGVELVIVPVGAGASEALAALPDDADAVYFGPLLRMPSEELGRLIEGVNERRLPSFSMVGVPEVEQGVLACVAPGSDYARLARRIAIYVQRILLGENPATFPVAYSQGERLTLNMETARTIGFHPSWAALAEADLLHEERVDIARSLTLMSVIEEAVGANLELLAKAQSVRAGAHDVDEAKANLKPHAEASLLGVVIDADRASASFGNQPEFSLTAGVGITQILFSEPAIANVRIQKLLQEGRRFDLDTVRLDIALEAVTTYLNVLRAKTFERIQREDLRRTRSHLEMARVRRVAGTGNPAEVYRWESELANSRKTLIQAGTQRSVAHVALNRVLHRPQEELFATNEIGLDDVRLTAGHDRLSSYLASPWRFRQFRDFMVREGLGASPELARLDAAVAAQERLLQSTRRAYYAPTVAMKADVNQSVWEAGEGTSGGLPIGSGIVQELISFPEPDDTDWSVGINLSIPLYEGGARKARHAKAKAQLDQRLLERQAVADRVEQAVRTALHAARGSHASIEQARLAADAARKNLDIVEDAYGQGVVSILDLLDAQTASTVAEQVAANAVHDFLIDLMKVYRTVGRYRPPAEGAQEAWFRRLEAFVAGGGEGPETALGQAR